MYEGKILNLTKNPEQGKELIELCKTLSTKSIVSYEDLLIKTKSLLLVGHSFVMVKEYLKFYCGVK